MTLWTAHVYGPVPSRRLGSSLGLNLLPNEKKLCNYDCPYCECGLTPSGRPGRLPGVSDLVAELRERLVELSAAGQRIDAITMAGNGEPTLHPQFEAIVGEVLSLRDELMRSAKVVVLSNATRLDRPDVFRALLRVDERQLKLDGASERSFRLLSAPVAGFGLDDLVRGFLHFDGNLVIQTLLTRGTVRGEPVDNTTPEEVAAYLDVLRKARPRRVALYALDRPAPEPGLEKLDRAELEKVASEVRRIGIPAESY